MSIISTAIKLVTSTATWISHNVSKKDLDDWAEQEFDEMKLSIAELCNKKSPSIDDYILEVEEKEDVIYEAGTFSIIKDGDTRFYLLTDLYFKKPSGKIMNKKIKSDLLEIREELNSEAINELNKEGKLTFDVHHSTNR